MSQLTFAEAEYVHKKHKTRREIFLEKMEALIPFSKLEENISRYYSKGKNGRPPYALSVMLRVHCLQLFYNLSDPAMEDALHEIESMRRFAGLSLANRMPDETTILNFRHFLEKHKLGKVIFDTMNQHLATHGLILREGSIVDATILSAPSSTKNKSNARDPEMHQTKKGQQWYFGMKMHIGVDDALGLIHSVETTSAEVHDVVVADKLLHGEEKRFFSDAGYTGIEKREGHKERKIHWMVAMKPGQRAQLPENSLLAKAEKCKASVRAKVEHSFFYIKRVFGYSKVRYRGLEKNTNRLHVLAAFSNLMMARRYLPT